METRPSPNHNFALPRSHQLRIQRADLSPRPFFDEVRPMRTAADFNSFYESPDPWRISQARFRDKVLRHCLTPFIRDRSGLELGCGEGHLTEAVFGKARSVVGVDISDVAIARAKSLDLPNVRFECADFLRMSFAGYDVIAAIECIHYLSLQERGLFLEKVATEHSGKMLLLSGPIVDYIRQFGHKRLMHEFASLGFTPVKFHNLSVDRYPPSSRIIASLLKLPLGYTLLDGLPERIIYQRLYALQAPKYH
jgi:SAM-dependent methyltransferase